MEKYLLLLCVTCSGPNWFILGPWYRADNSGRTLQTLQSPQHIPLDPTAPALGRGPWVVRGKDSLPLGRRALFLPFQLFEIFLNYHLKVGRLHTHTHTHSYLISFGRLKYSATMAHILHGNNWRELNHTRPLKMELNLNSRLPQWGIPIVFYTQPLWIWVWDSLESLAFIGKPSWSHFLTWLHSK